MVRYILAAIWAIVALAAATAYVLGWIGWIVAKGALACAQVVWYAVSTPSRHWR